ncbi:hypothetical protein BC628DRAFT_1418064 [Trametes gibbosa]|nr:hypothetical protein BC628DRAFT_1418064 [Trametes gibbosa]
MPHQFENPPPYWQPRPKDAMIPPDNTYHGTPHQWSYKPIYAHQSAPIAVPKSSRIPASPRDDVRASPPVFMYNSYAGSTVTTAPPAPYEEYDYPPPWQGKGIWNKRGRGHWRGHRGDRFGLTPSTRSVFGGFEPANHRWTQPQNDTTAIAYLPGTIDRSPLDPRLDPRATSFNPEGSSQPRCSPGDLDINVYMASTGSESAPSVRVDREVPCAQKETQTADKSNPEEAVMPVNETGEPGAPFVPNVPVVIATPHDCTVSQTSMMVSDAIMRRKASPSPASSVTYVTASEKEQQTLIPSSPSSTTHPESGSQEISHETAGARSPKRFMTADSQEGTPQSTTKPESVQYITTARDPPSSTIDTPSPVPHTVVASLRSSSPLASVSTGVSEPHVLCPTSLCSGDASVIQQLYMERIDRLEAHIELLRSDLQAVRLELAHAASGSRCA